MIGERPVENLAVPVGEAVQTVAELSHAAGKRVFVNQFYRVEVLRDVDGVCHENDYLPALGYLTPLASRLGLASSQTVPRRPAGVRGATQTAAPMGPVPADDRASVPDLAAGARPARRGFPGAVRAALRHRCWARSRCCCRTAWK